LSAQDLDEIQRIRIHLEGEAAALAAERITKAELAKLEKIQEDFQKAAGRDARESAMQNRRFHFGLLSAARAPLIYTTVEKMWVLMGPLLRRFHQLGPGHGGLGRA
jgi:DNA-binding GntR family transcriptional regulator